MPYFLIEGWVRPEWPSCPKVVVQRESAMNRRNLSVAAMVCLLSLAGVWGAFAQEKRQYAADSKMDCSKDSSECLLACLKCHKTCMEMIAKGEKNYHQCASACLGCAEFCRICQAICARGGPMMGICCEACAKACDMCGEVCAKFPNDPDIANCAKECKECAASCRMCIKMDSATK